MKLTGVTGIECRHEYVTCFNLIHYKPQCIVCQTHVALQEGMNGKKDKVTSIFYYLI